MSLSASRHRRWSPSRCGAPSVTGTLAAFDPRDGTTGTVPVLEEGETMSQAFFAMDGSYGDALGMVVIDVSAWSYDDWRRVADASDSERLDLAIEIAVGHRSE